VLDEVVNILFYIAEADGTVSDSEINYIKNVSTIFGLNSNQFESIRETRVGSHKQNPYVVLGCQPNDDLKLLEKNILNFPRNIIQTF
jgi:DnaJ like chaperone protein